MNAPTDALLTEAADLLEEARRERDAARQEAADLREALRLAQVTPQSLLWRIKLDGLPANARLVVHAQNPADNHHWSLNIGQFTAAEVRSARGQQ